MLARGSGSEGTVVSYRSMLYKTSLIIPLFGVSSLALSGGRVVTAASSLPGGLALVTDSLLAELVLVALKLVGYGVHSA